MCKKIKRDIFTKTPLRSHAKNKLFVCMWSFCEAHQAAMGAWALQSSSDGDQRPYSALSDVRLLTQAEWVHLDEQLISEMPETLWPGREWQSYPWWRSWHRANNELRQNVKSILTQSTNRKYGSVCSLHTGQSKIKHFSEQNDTQQAFYTTQSLLCST